ncbi:MAG: chemotaxis protein CheD [Phycisphaerae bacterium]|nr:chemotaxis protein CheD [Phycisphaerae bacterium]
MVDISDAKCTNKEQDQIITYSLGSCIGVAVYDSSAKIGGMLHYQLPDSRADVEKSKKNPTMYADTGMAYLVKKMIAMGAEKKRMKVKIAGGAQMMNDAKVFQIGKRNYAAIRQVLWKNGMFIDAESIGGAFARTLSMNMADGRVCVKAQGSVTDL